MYFRSIENQGHVEKCLKWIEKNMNNNKTHSVS